MLSTVIEIIDFRKQDLSYQKENENIMFELIVADLLRRVEDLCRKGISKKYYDTEENLSYVKGRILIKENLKYNLVYKNKMYCRYSDFGPDTVENRIIKYTLYHLSQIYFTNPDLYRKAKRLLHYFEPVSLISYSKFPTIIFDKLTFHYRTIVTLCDLVISNSSLYVEKRGEVKFSSFLVDMDKLFEKFVYRLLESNLKEKGLCKK
ncbi:protein of unknown function [Candidatus Nitrosocosmicus franklandus]|uniref:Uncharacterized protein n=1 Tax=Candidatus Nitrosocosmicus franklandianus TaxID=1798806 RepID=A0A484ICR2_9ARCH|nr:protein of unknown function [Candidatus Nitrosocosmicus franklandus]